MKVDVDHILCRLFVPFKEMLYFCNKKSETMKKVTFLIVLAGLLTACGNKTMKSEVNQVTVVDSAEVETKDSVMVSAEADEGLLIPIDEFRAFLDTIDVQHAEKCGLTYLYVHEEGGEDGDAGSYDTVYGRNMEKGEKTDFGYELKSKSNHACYFQYSLDTSTHASLNFTDKADADRFFEAFLKSGVVDCSGMYVVVEQEIPAGKVISVDSMRDYNGKYSIDKPVLDPERGFYTIIICWFA